MQIRVVDGRLALLGSLSLGMLLLPAGMQAASCKTQSQMPATQRDALSNVARNLMSEVQSGDVQALRQNTLPAVAADFAGIESTAEGLKPLINKATITVDNIFVMDSTSEPAGSPRTDFFCGSPVVVMNFNDLPPGMYALVILHATGVPQPQQVTFILAETADHRWLLGGFSAPKPMLEAGHDGLWYWIAARKYAQKNQNWGAWFYYRTAADYLRPVDFLSSPNLEKLQKEEDKVHPDGLPATATTPLMLNAQGSVFRITMVDTTTTFGALDLEVQYVPDDGQVAQLRDPPTARKQVTQVMTTLLAQHPELREAFHGIWVHADQGSVSLFSLELPMDQIVPGA
jgi:hypothetical protein